MQFFQATLLLAAAATSTVNAQTDVTGNRFADFKDGDQGLQEYTYAGENPNCQDLGFSFGWKMDSCQARATAIQFDSLEKTGKGITCDPYDVGAFYLECSDDGIDATITPKNGDIIVKMKGGNGGTVYKTLLKGETYDLDVGQQKQISHIEFCFKCDDPVVETQLELTTEKPSCPAGDIGVINHDAADSINELKVQVVIHNDDSHFDLVVRDAPYAPQGGSIRIPGWCVDYSRSIGGKSYDMDVFSAFDPDVIALYGGTGSSTSAVDFPEKLPNLGWLMNNIKVGDNYDDGAECSGTIDWNEYQVALWYIIDDKKIGDSFNSYYNRNNRQDCISRGLAEMAETQGNGWNPDCSKPGALVPLLFIADTPNNVITNQVLMGEVELASIEGMCVCEPDPKSFTDPPTVAKTPAPTDAPVGKCYPVMDFDQDGDGVATSAGDLAKNLWSQWGVTINSSNSNKPAMLFDTKNPTGGDTDLADDTEGMVLIISEDGDQSDPDDNAGGGTLTFEFEECVEIDSIGLFDLEEKGRIKMWDGDNKRVVNKQLVRMPDGQKRRMNFGESCISKMEVYFKGSGALTDIQFCEPAATTTTPPDTCTKQDFLQECTNTNQCKGMYSGADDCSNSGGGVCYCGGKVCGCEQEPTTTTDDVMTTTSRPGTQGDPHFKTHGGEMYDFHGGCDLVLLDNPDFMDGLGMLVHIRTKIETWWSYVETSAVRIGEDTIEISERGIVANGVAIEHSEEIIVTKFAGLVTRYMKKGSNYEAHIHFGNGEKLVMKTFKGFVKVQVSGEGSDYYKGSHGLLGRFPDGKRVGRDGETLIEDVNAFGQEWQVSSEEPKLFQSYDGEWIVPAGQKCAMPETSIAKSAMRRRRLANGMPQEEADKACAHLESAGDREACVFDVISTQSLDMASVW